MISSRQSDEKIVSSTFHINVTPVKTPFLSYVADALDSRPCAPSISMMPKRKSDSPTANFTANQKKRLRRKNAQKKNFDSDSRHFQTADLGKDSSSAADSVSNDNDTYSTTVKIPLPSSIIISSDIRRKIGLQIFNNPNFSPEDITTKATSDSTINIKTSNSSQFRSIQNHPLSQKVEFHKFTLAANRQSKVVIRGIPSGYSIDDVKAELETLNFDVKLVKRFGTKTKPLLICMVILVGSQAKETIELFKLFFLKIMVETFIKTGPSQCHTCQHFGNGSSNCGFPPRCLKCVEPHKTIKCQKTREQVPTCVNCGEVHTANYRKCAYFLHELSISAK